MIYIITAVSLRNSCIDSNDRSLTKYIKKQVQRLGLTFGGFSELSPGTSSEVFVRVVWSHEFRPGGDLALQQGDSFFFFLKRHQRHVTA